MKSELTATDARRDFFEIVKGATEKHQIYRILHRKGPVVLLSAEDSSVHSLDAVGTRIWELCDGEKTVSEIVDLVVSEFEVDRETAEKDVVEFIEELMQKEKSLVTLS